MRRFLRFLRTWVKVAVVGMLSVAVGCILGKLASIYPVTVAEAAFIVLTVYVALCIEGTDANNK